MTKSRLGKIKKQAIVPRIDGIESDLQKLKNLRKLSLAEFSSESNFISAQYYLRRALEGVFHIGGHILSRLPGKRATEYKQIAVRLGETGIVTPEFAKTKLKQMAGYRNRLTHFYADVTPEEIFGVLKNDLADIEFFLKAIRDLLEKPQKFDLSIE